MPKYKGAIKDEYTGEWKFNGKWYDHYPYKEVKEHNERMDEAAERELDESWDCPIHGRQKGPDCPRC